MQVRLGQDRLAIKNTLAEMSGNYKRCFTRTPFLIILSLKGLYYKHNMIVNDNSRVISR